MNRLTPRQLEVRDLLSDGLSEKEVANQLKISPHTVHVHVKLLYKKPGVSSRGRLFAKLRSEIALPA